MALILALGLLTACLAIWFPIGHAMQPPGGYVLSVQLLDPQGQPIALATVSAIVPGKSETLSEGAGSEWSLTGRAF